MLQHYQGSEDFCESVRHGFVRYGQWPDADGKFASYTEQEVAVRERNAAGAAASKAKKAKKYDLSAKELLAKERAEVGVFLAEAGGLYGLDKLDMQMVGEVVTLDDVAAKVIDQAIDR